MNNLQYDIRYGIVEKKMLDAMMLGLDSCVIMKEPYKNLNVNELQIIILELKVIYPDFDFKQLYYKDDYIIMATWQPSCCQLF